MKEFEFVFWHSTLNNLKKLQKEFSDIYGEEFSLEKTVYHMMTVSEYWVRKRKQEMAKLDAIEKRQKEKQQLCKATAKQPK